MTSPVVTFIAARIETVPCRMYSNSRGRPGGVDGHLGVLAGFRLDAGLLIDADQHGAGRRVQVQPAIAPARTQNVASSARLSEPRTLCGRTFASPSTRPTVDADIARPVRAGELRSSPVTTRFPLGRERGGDRDDRQPGARTVYLRPPGPGLIEQPRDPGAANRPRQARTIASLQPRSRAIWVFALPSAAASTILARSTSRCGLVPAATICSSLRRRFFVSRQAQPGRGRYPVLLPCHDNHGRMHPNGPPADIRTADGRPREPGAGITAGRRH